METLIEDDFSGGLTDFYLDPPPTKSFALDNLLITKDKSLIARPGSELYDVDYPRPVGVTTRIGKTFEFNGNIFMVNGDNLWRYTVSGWVELTGTVTPATDVAFPGADESNFTSVVQQNNHLIMTSDKLTGSPRKAYKDNLGTWRIFSAGLPALTFTSGYPTFAASHPADAKSYLYYFVAYRTYTLDGGVIFQDLGPVANYQATAMSNMTIAGRTITITPGAGNIWPHPVDTATEFYDQTNLRIQIYRTKTDATVGFLVGDVAAGFVGTFVDNKRDTQLGAELYITGDVYDWDPPPISKYVVQCQDIVWYLNCKEVEGGVLVPKPFRVRQSIKFAGDKCPASFFTDVDGDIIGGSSVGDFPLIFTESKFWRLEGYVDNQGNGFVRKILVSDTIGCISNDSIVRSQRGVAFAGNDGFYFTDGYRTTRLSDDISETYGSLITELAGVTKEQRRKRICGAYDRVTDRYWWTVQNDPLGLDNDGYVIWDSNWGVKSDAAFTTASSDGDMAPTSTVFVDGVMLRGDSRGYLLSHGTSLYNDIMIESTALPAEWFYKAVFYDYVSAARSMGNSTITKWAGVIQVVFVNHTNMILQTSSADDDTGDFEDMREMRFTGHFLWGDPYIIWGTPTLVWNYKSFIFFERRFPTGSLRFTYKQVRFQPAYGVIIASGTGALPAPLVGVRTAVISALFATATLDGVYYKWGTNFTGYFLHGSWDNYGEGYLIIGVDVTGLILTVDDPSSTLPTGDYLWEVRGYHKDERVILKNYVVTYTNFGNSQHGYRKTDRVGN